MHVLPKSLQSVLAAALTLGILFTPVVAFAQGSEDDSELFGGVADDEDLFGEAEAGGEEALGGAEPGGAEGQADDVALPEAFSFDAEEIIIQGQRQDSGAQSQAIAITTFNQQALDQLGVANVQGLQQNVPSLFIGRTGNQAIITIRGVGIENLTPLGEPGVLFIQDGIPILRPSAALGAFYDVRGVDVSRGPQGTQGGRHATGGWIQIDSAPPTPDFSAQGDFQLGTRNQYVYRGALNTPIYDDKLMMRMTARFEDRDGYQRLIGTRFPGGDVLVPRRNFHRSEDADNAHDWLFRGQLRSVLGDGLDLRLIGQYALLDNNGPGVHLLSEPGIFTQLGATVCKFGADRLPRTSSDPRVSYRDAPGDLRIAQGFTTAIATQDLATEPLGDLRLVGQFGFNRTDQDANFDFDGTDACANTISLVTVADQYTGELSLATVDARPWEWKLGMFYLQEVQEQDNFVNLSGSNDAPDQVAASVVDTRSLAAYLEIKYWFTESLHAAVGLRAIDDVKDVFSATVTGLGGALNPIKLEKRYRALTPKLLLDWNVTDANKITLNITNGFKAGGFPLGRGCSESPDDPEKCAPYDQERVWQYELTSKNEFFGERLRLNVSLFWTDYDPYQVCFIEGVAFTCFDNGTATVRGIEIEWRAFPLPEIQIDGNFNLLDARIDDFRIQDPTLRRIGADGMVDPNFGFPQDLSGNRLPKAPKYNLNVGIQYDLRVSELGLPEWGTISPRMQYQYQSRTFFRVFNKNKFSQPDFSKVDFRLTWRSNDDRWSVEGFVNNVTDVDVINSLFVLPATDGSVLAQYQPPRTAGIRLGFRY